MKIRLSSSLTLIVVTLLVAAGCGGGSGSEDGSGDGGGGDQGSGGGGGGEVQPAMVTDAAGLGDQSFNDSANRGIERAADEFGVETEVLESEAPTDYSTNVQQLAQNSFNPIYAIGFAQADALEQIAPQFPDTNFAIVDSTVDQPNVASLVFQDAQGAYLVGVVAGEMTQVQTEFTNSDDKVVGFLGGQESPLISSFEAGFTAGVESACADCEVQVQYAGSTVEAFNDPARGKEIALQMNNQGADIIYHAAGATGAGLFEAAGEEGFFAIGTDSDQADLYPDAPILTSAVKSVDNALFQTIQQARDGEFPGGEVVEFGLENNGYRIASYGRFEDQVPQEVKDAVDEARQGIIDGDVTVPDEPQ